MNTSEMAKILNVTETDLMMLLNSVVESIKTDKAVDCFLGMSESERVEMSQAYIVHAVKKFESFVTSYITNQDKKQSFNEYIFELLKGDSEIKK